MKYIYKLSLLFVFLVLHQNANAQYNADTYQRMANTSSKIVKGKITNKRPITYELDGQILTCGWVLDIDVIESWKGGDDNFSVFANHSDILLGDDLDYFLFAKRNPQYSTTRENIDFINCDGFNSTRMNLSPFEFFATDLKQQIFPIVSYNGNDNVMDTDTNMTKRGEWMLIVDRISNSYLPDTIQRRRLNGENQKIIEEMSLSDFLKEFILYR